MLGVFDEIVEKLVGVFLWVVDDLLVEKIIFGCDVVFNINKVEYLFGMLVCEY